MIGYIKGELVEVEENYVIVEQGGMGYNISITNSSIMELPPKGSSVKLYTYLNVREDAISLFGFLDKDELVMFKQLITVSGIGPKSALGMLSAISPDEIRFAVLAEDIKTLTKAPGVGKKTAAKLVLELKDKFDLEEAFEQKLINNQRGDKLASNQYSKRQEAVEALTVLGYSGSDALRVVNQVEITDDMTAEDILKLCLKKL